jgi:hypothetical protein
MESLRTSIQEANPPQLSLSNQATVAAAVVPQLLEALLGAPLHPLVAPLLHQPQPLAQQQDSQEDDGNRSKGNDPLQDRAKAKASSKLLLPRTLPQSC